LKGFFAYGAVLLVSVALFSLTPIVDIYFSGLFYNPQHGFVLADWRPLAWLEGLIPWISTGLVVLFVTGGLWLRLTGRRFLGLDRNALIFIVVAAALGPGLIVNTGLKDHWGRARPNQIEQFGGAKAFTPALAPSDQCAR